MTPRSVHTIPGSAPRARESTAQWLSRQKRDIRESSFALVLSILTGIGAGLVLGHAQETLLLLPGLVILIPAAMGMRGSIGAALGSRIATGLHLGTISTFSAANKTVRANVYAALMLSILLSVFLAFLSKSLSDAFGLASISLSSFIVISVIGGTIAGLVLVAVTFATAVASYRRGWDLDNIQAPLITAAGDLFTIPSLLFAAYLTQMYSSSVDEAALAILAGCGLMVAYLILKKDMHPDSYRTIVVQSVLVLAAAGTIDAVAGGLLEGRIQNLATVPVLLVLLPVFLEEGGNIGNTLASRLSTKLHLGTISTRMKLTVSLKREFMLSFLLSLFIFPLTGLLVYAASALAGVNGIAPGKLVLVTAVSGYVLTAVIMATTYLISVWSYRYNFDPDSTTIPIVTALADILGVLVLLSVASSFGIF